MVHQWRLQSRGRSCVGLLLAASTAWFTSGSTLPTTALIPAQSLHLADITIQVPIVIPGYPVIVVPRRDVEQSVTVRFLAEGNDWASIYLDGRLLFRANNTRRDYTVQLDPGAYYLEVTGVTSFDRWATGYLDVGRNDANVVIIRYGKDSGVRVAGDPYVWLPDQLNE